jgi:hypothetical protein
MVERLTTEAEVIETIREASWQPAEKRKQRASKWNQLREMHRATLYVGKDVEPVFSEESDRIVVVTVYVYLNQRGESR